MKTPFKFICSGKLIDRNLELVLVKTTLADPIRGYVPGYEFEMRHPGRAKVMGTIRLRIGSAVTLRYPGHIGYEVKKPFRGQRYAARSCKLLLPLASAHGLKALWMTVDPKNISSRKTCEIIGAKYIETVRIPDDHEMYEQGTKYRRRYRLDISKELSKKTDADDSQ